MIVIDRDLFEKASIEELEEALELIEVLREEVIEDIRHKKAKLEEFELWNYNRGIGNQRIRQVFF